MLGQPFGKITTVLSLYQSDIQVISKAADSLAIYFTPVAELSAERSNICTRALVENKDIWFAVCRHPCVVWKQHKDKTLSTNSTQTC